MPDHELPLAAFLAGDLEPEHARLVDEHLLSCDRCWLAVREDRAGRAAANLLRQPTDHQLADRIRLAVELAPPRRRLARRTRPGDSGRGALAALAVAVVLAVLTALTLWHQHHTPATDTAALREVIRLASKLPATHSATAAVALDAPHKREVEGRTITVRTYAFEGHTALLATSSRPFAMPPDAHMTTRRAMPWTITRGTITVYCPHADVLLAGPEPAAELAALADALHLT
jgi:anti-sigma factor RsiW